MLTAIILLVMVIVVCSFFGVKFFIKYKRTRKTKYLILSLLLGFIALVLIILALSALIRTVTVVYGPPPVNDYTPIGDSNVTPPNVVYGPPPG